MSFSEPKWREHVQARESAKKAAKRASGVRKIERSLRRCDDLQLQRLKTVEKQHELKMAYQAEVAYRSTAQMLKRFRQTFQVEKDSDARKRHSDKNYQIRMYTKVDRDAWEYDDLREWYNSKKGGETFVSANQALDSASSSFCVEKPGDTDSSSLFNKNSHYMLQAGGPHDPSGFLANVNAGRASPGSRTVSQGFPQPTDPTVMSTAVDAGAKRDLPHLHARSSPAGKPQMAKLDAPHWGHWQKNLKCAWAKVDNMKATGQIPPAQGAPWAEGY